MVFFFIFLCSINIIALIMNNYDDSNMVNDCSVETRCYRTDEIVKYVKNIGSAIMGYLLPRPI